MSAFTLGSLSTLTDTTHALMLDNDESYCGHCRRLVKSKAQCRYCRTIWSEVAIISNSADLTVTIAGLRGVACKTLNARGKQFTFIGYFVSNMEKKTFDGLHLFRLHRLSVCYIAHWFGLGKLVGVRSVTCS